MIEPDPAGGASLQLVQVSMPRGSVTQTRSFSYLGTDLISTTNPENGTVTYEYINHRVTKRTDARGQETRYIYDAYGRLTQVQHWAWGYDLNTFNLVLQEQTDQRYDYYYDTKPCDPTFSQNAWGAFDTPAWPTSIL